MRTRVLLFFPFFFCVVLSRVTGQVVTKVACTEYQAGWLYSDGTARSFIFNTLSGHVEFTPFQIGGRKAVDISTGFNRITMLDDQGYVWLNNGGQATATRWDKDAYGNTFDGNVSIYGYFFTYLSIRKDGSIWYWGGDDYKFYGGRTLNAPVKLHTPPGVKFTKLSTGNALMALSTTGDVYYWDKTDSNYTKIPLPKPASDIAASHMGYYIVVVPDDITVSRMGWPYAFGPESKYWGSQVPAAPTAPVSIKALWKMQYPIREINANQNTLHYIDSQGDMYGLGDNANGEVGNGEELVNHAEKYATPYAWNWGKYGLMVSSPVKILPGTKWKHLFTGNSFVFYNYATDVNDSLYFWGRNKSFVGGDGVSNNMEATLPNALDVLKPTLRTPLKLKPTDATIYSFTPYTLKTPAKQKVGANSATLSATATPSTLTFPGKPNYGYTIVKYQWAQISGPANSTITTPNALNTTVTGLVTGTYVYSIQTTDNNTGTITAYDTLVVNTSGIVLPDPVANAGANQTITLPASSVTLTGTGQGRSASSTSTSVSSGTIPTITSYQWSQVSGPNNATFANAKAAQTTVSGLIAGTYVFQLTVTDSQGQTGSAQVTVKVNPATSVPTLTVNAGANQTVTLPAGATVTGTVTATNNSVTSYLWTQVSGPSAANFSSSKTAQSAVTGLVAGTYVFKLTVTGSTGLTASAQLTLTVNPALPATLTVNAGANQTITWPSRANVAGTATATNSTVKSYQWLQVSGPAVAYFINSKVAQTQAVGLVAGTYVFKLTVTGSTGLTASSQMTLTVKPAPVATLTVNAGPDQTITLPSRADVAGTATATNITVTSYQWTQVSGPAVAYFINSKVAQTQAVGLVAGTYVFKLTVTGSTGLTASAVVTVTAKTATTARAVTPDGEISALSAGDSTDDASRTAQLYPNPVMTDQQLTVEGQGWKEGTLKFSIYDLGGRVVKQVVLDNQFSYFRQTISAAGLTKGVYMLSIQAEGQKPKVLKFIVQ